MNRTVVEEIKARIPIDELIGSYIKIEKSGRSLKARCPFHNEKTPSFFISPDRGGYYCFGCGAKGDIFSFVEQFEGLDFKGALKVLAEKAGVPLVFDQKADSDKDNLFRITEEVAKYFEENLKKSKSAQDYIKSRGLRPETIQSFRIGWAPEGWQNLFNYLKEKGWNETIIEKAGFIKKKDGEFTGISGKERYYDRFRGRIMFPITDSSGRVVAFTGRILKDDGKSAKYLNSPETPIFIKSQILFGLDKAKSEIRRLNYSILVEGQMDLILSHQSGVKNTIAASGTALTDQATSESGIISNLGMVRRLSSNMILALDSDKAGKTATMRAVTIVALSMGMSVKIAQIDGGKDPADLILKNPDDWKEVLKNSKHVIEFELNNIIKDTSDPRRLGKEVRDRLFPFISRMESEMDKAFYIKMIAERSGLNEQSVWEDIRKYEKTNKVSGTSETDHRQTLSTNVGGSTRVDLIERRMFGLLSLMERDNLTESKLYRLKIEEVSGKGYGARVARIQPILGDLSFEAEAFFGANNSQWNIHMKELLLNFERDIINEELIATMGELRKAEHEGNNALVAELAKRCQELSIKKAGVGK